MTSKFIVTSGIFILCFFYITGVFGSILHEAIRDPRESLGKNITSVMKYAETKYGFLPVGSSISFPDKLNSVGIDFQTNKQIPKDKLRHILIDIAIYFRKTLNDNSVLKSHMHHYPFELNDVEIVIYFIDGTDQRVFHPNLNVAEISNGYFIFRTVDPENTNKYKESFKEKVDQENYQ